MVSSCCCWVFPNNNNKNNNKEHIKADCCRECLKNVTVHFWTDSDLTWINTYEANLALWFVGAWIGMCSIASLYLQVIYHSCAIPLVFCKIFYWTWRVDKNRFLWASTAKDRRSWELFDYSAPTLKESEWLWYTMQFALACVFHRLHFRDWCLHLDCSCYVMVVMTEEKV